MQIVVLSVGKLKEKFWREAQEEYKKRLQSFASLHVQEVADEPGDQEDRVKAAESDRIFGKLRDRDFVIALDANGTQFSSLSFAKYVEDMRTKGAGRYVFIIGGSHGLSDKVLVRADMVLSFSDLTFPHQLMRIILLEQLYRAFRILSGAPYHK